MVKSINFNVVPLTLATESKMKNKGSGQFHLFTVIALVLDHQHSQAVSVQTFQKDSLLRLSTLQSKTMEGKPALQGLLYHRKMFGECLFQVCGLRDDGIMNAIFPSLKCHHTGNCIICKEKRKVQFYIQNIHKLWLFGL